MKAKAISILVATLVLFSISHMPGAPVVAHAKEESQAIPVCDHFDGQPAADLNMEEVKLLAAVIWAEAEGEDMYGKKLVGSVVLNRRDDNRGFFPDTIKDVIFQPGQFTVVDNGRFDQGYILQEPSCVQAAMEELMGRTDSNVLFFCAGGWGYGTPYLQHGNHYFSTLY